MQVCSIIMGRLITGLQKGSPRHESKNTEHLHININKYAVYIIYLHGLKLSVKSDFGHFDPIELRSQHDHNIIKQHNAMRSFNHFIFVKVTGVSQSE